VIAINERTGDVLAMGDEAWHMIGRTPEHVVAKRPLRKGAITEFDVTQRMVRLLLERVGVSRFNRPKVLVCVPSAITAVERRAVTEAARKAGAADAQLIDRRWRRPSAPTSRSVSRWGTWWSTLVGEPRSRPCSR